MNVDYLQQLDTPLYFLATYNRIHKNCKNVVKNVKYQCVKAKTNVYF